MLTTVLLLTDQGRFTDMVSSRSAYLSTESQARQWLDVMKKQKEQPHCSRLQDSPKAPSDLDPERLRYVFGEGALPASLPAGVNMEMLKQAIDAFANSLCKFPRAFQVAVMFK